MDDSDSHLLIRTLSFLIKEEEGEIPDMFASPGMYHFFSNHKSSKMLRAWLSPHFAILKYADSSFLLQVRTGKVYLFKLDNIFQEVIDEKKEGLENGLRDDELARIRVAYLRLIEELKGKRETKITSEIEIVTDNKIRKMIGYDLDYENLEGPVEEGKWIRLVENLAMISSGDISVYFSSVKENIKIIVSSIMSTYIIRKIENALKKVGLYPATISLMKGRSEVNIEGLPCNKEVSRFLKGILSQIEYTEVQEELGINIELIPSCERFFLKIDENEVCELEISKDSTANYSRFSICADCNKPFFDYIAEEFTKKVISVLKEKTYNVFFQGYQIQVYGLPREFFTSISFFGMETSVELKDLPIVAERVIIPGEELRVVEFENLRHVNFDLRPKLDGEFKKMLNFFTFIEISKSKIEINKGIKL
ncbi:hypothetical protein [Acidianus sp. RZ1]|uniref:hypothetical protein n=1 Tax=Acidianus sp. RZ1 TaxID=1540082 RepID=UPI001492D150|nr:hypothetical protein [Acidianus sp. RZ1]NON61426.1 hypothetical protein [Acidianus sp. RZ1]